SQTARRIAIPPATTAGVMNDSTPNVAAIPRTAQSTNQPQRGMGGVWTSLAGSIASWLPLLRNGDVVAGEHAAVPVSLEAARARTPSLHVEVELLGRSEAAPVDVDRHPVGGHLLEPVRPPGAAGEAGSTARSRRLRVCLE